MNRGDNVRSIVLKADRLIVLQQGPLWNERTLPQTHNEIQAEWMGREKCFVCVFIRKPTPMTFIFVDPCLFSVCFSTCVCFELSYFPPLCLFRVSLRGKSQADCVLSPTQADNR